MLQSPNPRQTNVLLGAARVRTGPTPAFFARGASSASGAVEAVGDVEAALAAVGVVAVGGEGGASGGVLSVFILGM